MDIAPFIPVVGIIYIIGLGLFFTEYFLFPGTQMFGWVGLVVIFAAALLSFVLLGWKYGSVVNGIAITILGIMFWYGKNRRKKSKESIEKFMKGESDFK
jgi:membrane protein implicated in regulation of membrane protease activity